MIALTIVQTINITVITAKRIRKVKIEDVPNVVKGRRAEMYFQACEG